MRPENAPRFRMQWEGEAPQNYTLASMLQANADDEKLCRWLREAPRDACRIEGGGAAPACYLRRVA